MVEIVWDGIFTSTFAMPLSGFSVRGFVAGAFYLASPEKTKSLMLPETVFLSSKLYMSWVINKDEKAAMLPQYFNSHKNRKMPCVIYRRVTFNGTNYNKPLLRMWQSNPAYSLFIHWPLQQKMHYCHKATVILPFSFTSKGSRFRLKHTRYTAVPSHLQYTHPDSALVPRLRLGTA